MYDLQLIFLIVVSVVLGIEYGIAITMFWYIKDKGFRRILREQLMGNKMYARGI